MAERRLDEQERRALAAAVADDLRAIVADLSEREISDGDLAAAAELTRSLRERLDGPRRARWYEDDATAFAGEDRFAYLDQSPVRGRLNPIAPPMTIEVVERPDGTPSRRGPGATRTRLRRPTPRRARRLGGGALRRAARERPGARRDHGRDRHSQDPLPQHHAHRRGPALRGMDPPGPRPAPSSSGARAAPATP